MSLHIFSRVDCSAYKPYFTSLRYYYRKALKVLDVKRDLEVYLVLVNDGITHKFNKEYRNVNRPTDVLSFASMDDPDYSEDNPHIGDILVSLDAVKRQATEYGHSEKRELCFLFIHGLLHCLGYDHMTKEDEEVMFSLQDKILERLK